jgi:hypothetical protein
VASYTHDTSRQLDPQIHTHAVAANLTYDGTEGRWKALQASGLYERRSYLTEVYRNALAREVRALGYEVENRHDVRGRDKGFEIAGFSQHLLDKYSQRSAQRDAAIQEFTNLRGRAPTDNEVAVLVRETRVDKLQEISTERVRNLQQERLSADERQTLREVSNEAQTQFYSPRINRKRPTNTPVRRGVSVFKWLNERRTEGFGIQAAHTRGGSAASCGICEQRGIPINCRMLKRSQ